MLNLEPLIARLVNDVLHAIRGAALAELRAVLESSEQELERKPRAPGRSRVARPPVKNVPASRARNSLASGALTETRSHPEPEPHSEITDPERLLAPASPQPAPPSERAGASPPVEAAHQEEPLEAEEEPANDPTPAAEVVTHSAGNAPARLRVGESQANTTGTGMVIRRAKKT